MTDFCHDFGSCCRPDEGTGIPVVLMQIVVNGTVQFGHTSEGSAANALAGDLRKPALHQLEPRSPRGGEMQMVTGVSREPCLHLGVRVRPVIVEDHMNVSTRGCGPLNPPQELQELDVTLPWQTGADHGSVQHVQGGEQSGRTMTHI